MTVHYLYGFTVLVLVIFSAIVIVRQQQTIDNLTEKLMAKDYGEYKRFNQTLMQEEKPRRKPLSFYDDPGIEVEDEAQ